jgi:HSP20 family protein
MADLATRSNGSRNLFSDVLGFDPFRNYYPASHLLQGVDIVRGENGYTVELAVPGFKPEQIDVTLDNGILTVSGKTEKRRFTRSLALPDEIDTENIQAKVEDGLLTLGLHFHPKAQPKKIAVQFGAQSN